MAARLERVLERLPVIQHSGGQFCILMNLYRVLTGIPRRNEQRGAAHLIAIEFLLFITRRDAVDLGQYPYLEQMHQLGLRSIEFAVCDSSACAHPLGFAGADDGPGAHAVFVFERSLEDVCDDFHAPMRMPGKSLSRSDAVFRAHAKRADTHTVGDTVATERKRATRVEPAIIGV